MEGQNERQDEGFILNLGLKLTIIYRMPYGSACGGSLCTMGRIVNSLGYSFFFFFLQVTLQASSIARGRVLLSLVIIYCEY